MYQIGLAAYCIFLAIDDEMKGVYKAIWTQQWIQNRNAQGTFQHLQSCSCSYA